MLILSKVVYWCLLGNLHVGLRQCSPEDKSICCVFLYVTKNWCCICMYVFYVQCAMCDEVRGELLGGHESGQSQSSNHSSLAASSRMLERTTFCTGGQLSHHRSSVCIWWLHFGMTCVWKLHHLTYLPSAWPDSFTNLCFFRFLELGWLGLITEALAWHPSSQCAGCNRTDTTKHELALKHGGLLWWKMWIWK